MYGQQYRSVECAYQCEKVGRFGLEALTIIMKTFTTAAQARRLGGEIPKSNGLGNTKFVFMNQLLLQKREQVKVFRRELLSSEGKELVHPLPDPFCETGKNDAQTRYVRYLAINYPKRLDLLFIKNK